MIFREQAVAIKLFPETFVGRQWSDFLHEVQDCLDVDRPSLVLDCSRLAHLDRHSALLLLRCLEEAMKRNGDVRLAGVSPPVRTALKMMEADMLFQFFETTAEAVASFQRRAAGLALREREQDASESAA